MRTSNPLLSRLAVATWVLVQVPAKDVRLSDPGSNMPPITEFKKVREFATAAECESFRGLVMQDSALLGSEAMLDQASSLRCVDADQLPGGTPSPAASPGTTP